MSSAVLCQTNGLGSSFQFVIHVRMEAVEGLDLGLFVDTEHHGGVRWVQIEANHVADGGVPGAV